MIRVTVDCCYQRTQFDDWLAGGKMELRGKTYYWSAHNSDYGFGWEVEPANEKDWVDISEGEWNRIMRYMERCLCEHRTDYVT